MKWMKSRTYQILAVAMVFMAALSLRLFGLTVVQGNEWEEKASNMSMKSIHTSAPRGEILDRYGRVLAGNTPSFTVQMSPGKQNNESLNEVSRNLIRILEMNGDTYYDNFPIVVGQDVFYYTYQKEVEEWLYAQAMPLDFTAQEAFDELCERHGVGQGLDKYDAQTELQTKYNVFPPITVKNMKYLKDLEKESFLQRFNLKEDMSAEDAFTALRKKFEIADNLSDDEARKIMVVRNQLSAQGYRQYMPAKVASGVSSRTIVIIEEKSADLPGVEVVAESRRYYPNGNTASHILGYLGQISESQKVKYVDELGYKSNDMIGQEGIEQAYESMLKGVDGKKDVEVNARGELMRVIEEQEPQKGKDVYLTIDLDLQITAEEALKQALTQIQRGGTFQSEWGNYNFGKAYRNANVGAVVALEVETGDVLAMANYPDFDPNKFATGISKEDWDALQGENPRDPLTPLPLFNVAARTAVQPGSTFKMVTAMAALENGLDPNRKLRDGGAVFLGNRSFGCVVWNRSKSNHGLINLYEALEVSCNYYFYDIATGYDFYKKTSLGLNSKMDISKLSSFAEKFGLGLATGIELRETVVPAPNEARKLSQVQANLRNFLLSRSEMYFEPEVVKNQEKLNQQIDTIVSWTTENPKKTEIVKRLEKMDVKEDMVDKVADTCKYSYFNLARWTTGDELNISIGQGENAYTPLQMANYVATIGNGGVLNQVSLIKAVEGQGVTEKNPGQKIDLKNEKNLDHVIEGMSRVVSGSKGSLRGAFAGFPVKVAGKTGTAEKGGKIPTKDEVEYLKQYLPRISSSLKWADVEAEMNRLMEEYPERYSSQNYAVRQAMVNLSKGKINSTVMDVYKSNYDNFAWVVTMAPADDPKIAVAVLIFQGGTAAYAAPVAKEVIAKYLELDKTYEDYRLTTTMTQ